MRVGLVVPGGVDPSGRERVIPALLALIERLARRHEVHVFALFHGPEPSDFPLVGATVHDLGLGRRGVLPGVAFLRAMRGLSRAVAKTGPHDILHAFWADTPGFLACRLGRSLSVPVVVSLGGGELVALPGIRYGSALTWRGRHLVGRTLRAAARVTAASGPMRDLAARRGIDAEIVPLGVYPAPFAGEPAPPGPPWRLLHVGDLNPVKDQATLLRALRLAVAAEPNLHLDIIGRDTLEGGIQALARQLGLTGHVTFHGHLAFDELIPFYRRAHLLVHSSRHEAGPLTALEAAAAGVATVGTAVGCLADWAPDLAVAVPVGDAAALGDAVVSLIRDPERRLAVARRARAWSLSHDADFTARRFEEIYRELTAA